MAAEDRVKALLRLGAEDTEEGRTAAHQAARLIHKHQMLDSPFFLSRDVAPALPVETAEAWQAPRFSEPAPRHNIVPPNPYSRAYQAHFEKIKLERREEERLEAERQKSKEMRVFSYASRLERASRR